MSSENHAAQLLGRTYPGGLTAAVAAMNAKAQLLGMHDTHFADPTGLSAENRSSPADLVRLVNAAYQYPVLREYSTSSETRVADRQARRALRKHQRPDVQPRVGDRPAEDRLHLRRRPLPGHAGGHRGPAGRDGAARFRRQVFADRRRAAHPSVAGGEQARLRRRLRAEQRPSAARPPGTDGAASAPAV